MAIFIPDSRPEDFNGSYGEMAVYDSLKQLSDDYTVFYSLSWVGSNNNRSIGEADFVISHPSKGILVIEVKNGDIEYKNGQWYQINSKSHKSKRIDPFVQARKSQFELMDRLNRGIRDHKRPMLCYAVWFTSVEISDMDILPMESPNEITMDMRDLSHPVEAIDAVYDYWAGKYEQVILDEEDYKKVIELLCPHFHVVAKWDGDEHSSRKSYIRLTDYQNALLGFLEEQNTAVISGIAGTGKTVLAVEGAKRLAKNEEPVLFLCFNKHLKQALIKKAAIPGVEYETADSLDADKEYTHIIVDEAHKMENELLDRLYRQAAENKGHFCVFCKGERFDGENKSPMWIDQAECRILLKQKFGNSVTAD